MSTIKKMGGLHSGADLLELLTKTFPNLSKAINGVRASFKTASIDMQLTTGIMDKMQVASNGLKGAIFSLWEVVAAHPVLAAVAALGLLYVAIQKINDYLPNVENTSKWLKESSEKVKTIQGEIDSLNNQLKTSNERIQELLNKDSLTLVEQNELNKLETTNAELEKQIKLKERSLQLAQIENQNNFNNNVNAIKSEGIIERTIENPFLRFLAHFGDQGNMVNSISLNAEENYDYLIDSYKNAEKELQKVIDEGNEGEIRKWEERKNSIYSEIQNYSKSLTEAKEQFAYSDYSALSDEAKSQLDYIQDVENQILIFTSSTSELAKNQKVVYNDIFNSDRFAKAKEAIGELDEVTSATLRTLYESNPDVRAMIDNMKDVGLITGSVGNSLGYLANQINGVDENGQSLNDTIEDVEDSADGLKDTIKELSTALDDMQKANKTISEIADNYSKNGFYSTDDIQSFLSLDKEYINLLIDENGQVNLNSQAYKEYVASKAKSLLVNELQDLYSSILGMKVEEAQAYANVKAYNEETRSVQDLLTATTQLYYAKAMAQDSANNTTAYTDAMSRSFNTAANYASMVDSYINSLSTSQNEFNHVMNEATDSTNEYKDALEAEKDSLEDAKDSLEDYKDELSEAQSSLKDLIDLVTDYIKQTKEDEKSALEEQIETLDKQKDALDESKEKYADLIDKKKEAIKAAYDEKKAQDELLDKQKSVAKDRLALEVAGLDDSSAGRKAQKQARDNLAESEKSLHEYQDERAYDFQIKELEDLQTQFEKKIEKRKAQIDSQVEHIEAKIDEIDKYLDNSRQMYEDACAMIDNDNGTLYSNLWNYTYTYTTQTKAEFDYLWSSAQEALAKYRGDNDSLLGVMETLQTEIYDTEGQIADLDLQIDEVGKSIDTMNQQINNSSGAINNVSSSIGGLASNIADYKRALDELANANNIENGNNSTKYGWKINYMGREWSTGNIYNADNQVNRNLAASQLANQIAKARNLNASELPSVIRDIQDLLGVPHFASGTRHSPAEFISQEKGLEAIFAKNPNSSGSYTLTTPDSQVFDAKRTDNLYNFSGNPEEFISKLAERGLSLLSGDELSALGWGRSIDVSQLFSGLFNSPDFVKNLTGLSGTTYNNDNSASNDVYSCVVNLNIQGVADQTTAQALTKAKRDIKDEMLKELTRLGERNRRMKR